MKIKFQDLPYQTDAVNSSVNVFKEETQQDSEFTISLLSGFQGSAFTDDGIGIANRQSISNEQMLKNVQRVQLLNKLPQSDSIFGTNDAFPQFNIEMETGTGKTFVYFKTILELSQKYGFKKFIIVVPSVAIKEGVIKTFNMTKETFANAFHGMVYNLFAYDGSKLDRVRQFASANTVDIMVMTMSSINKGNFNQEDNKGNINVVYRHNDVISGKRPIDLIAETHPILIIDEPQALDNTDNAKRALNNLNPLVAFRYSATHKDKSYPTLYKLDAVDAYNQQLVKQIEVSSISIDEDGNRAYMRLKEVDNKKGQLKAKVEVYKKTKKDADKKVITIKQGDNLEKKTKLPVYEEVGDVEDLDATPGQEAVYFSGQPAKITLSSATQEDIEEKRMQLKALIEAHLDKELKLNKLGIKVLSLIFLDHVDNYRIYHKDGTTEEGSYARIFEEEYNNLIGLPKYKTIKEHNDIPVEEVHQGYFARDKKGRIKNSKGESAADESEYQTIMRDKEGLLTMYDAQKHTTSANKTRFIFSHSALKEGWDNPNVFQIATLVDTKDPINKRQKIGRGLRIAVNQDGKRVPGFSVNTLTVIANESYKDFAKGLQHEYEEDGIKFGIFDDQTFSTIVTKQGEDADDIEVLGKQKSKELVNYLKEHNYISTTGHGLDKLKKAIFNDEIDLPDDLAKYQHQVLQLADQKMQGYKIKNARQRVDVKVNKQALSDNFLKLWNKIKQKTEYRINFDSEDLNTSVINGTDTLDGLNDISVSRGHYQMENAKLDMSESGVSYVEDATRTYTPNYHVDYQLPDIITILQNQTNLTRRTIIEILQRVDNLGEFKKNPTSYIAQATSIINAIKNQIIIKGIEYVKKPDEYYDQKLFSSETLSGYLGSEGNIVPIDVSKNKTVYDYIVTDSATEKTFAKALDRDENVKFYIKMPDWFTVPTPLGPYNPDWAVFRTEDNGEKLYFVADTKGDTSSEQLRPHEKGKLRAGKKSFEALDTGLIFKTVHDESELE